MAAIIRRKWSSFGFLLTLLHLSYQEKIPQTDYYTAAVVEFSPTYKIGNGLETLRQNSKAYVEYIEKASEQNADIIVFPEDGLTSLYMPDRSKMDSWATTIPSVLEEYVPCIEDRIDVSETLKRLSCAARQHRIYVVVNIAEKESCEQRDNCHWNGTRYHNTNVVFDRAGKIIARYRKVNLYMEQQFDTTETPEIVTFDTDFGVRFGTFICFDILFWEPALNLTRQQEISNFVFTTAWFSEVPFLTAVQTQFGWSFAEDVNLLAAGYHKPESGSAGSGIYLGRRGIANATFARNPEHRLLISRVPKTTESRKIREEEAKRNVEDTASEKKDCSNMVGEKLPVSHRLHLSLFAEQQMEETADWISLFHDNITSFESLPLNVSLTDTICHGNFCCHFHVHMAVDDPRIAYRAVVYNGVRLYGTETEAGVRTCALIQCRNDSILSCGFAEPSNATFTALSVTATFPDYTKILVVPSVLDSSSLLPFEHWTYDERVYDQQTHLTIALNQPIRNLATFGIYARDFTKDKRNRS